MTAGSGGRTVETVRPEQFRAAMAAVCSPVAVATALADGRPYGTTVSAFSSLSLDPPMVLVALGRGSDLLAAVRGSGRFGLNVLCSSQTGLARNFARKGGPAKFAEVPWRDRAGVPGLPGAGCFVACELDELVEAGDHVLVIGRVVDAEASSGPPLTYHDRAFGTSVPL